MSTCDKQVCNRLKRAEGQLRGVQKMIEEGKECQEVIMQLSAVRASVDRIMGTIVAENLKNCFENPEESIENQTKKLEQAIQLIVKR
ncbi:hypothetical protein BMT55_01995 [Listeria newyorkensis]|uniref:DNA-binding transcriptional regulator, FrmR family n=1 Tax=Listeria newyorkensis TaxID=1497681 RepID=A0ABX4XQ46_9LIST|nr:MULTISPECIES: metal-sensitive transcriptional regulator [Listeria]KGL46392.1 hypothetical protein EP56_02025 [Listeriaceae bacterium FSL A5-0209]KGL41808.1 hypothetical protein EP58_09685 [Listeria newyorkensis]KMT58304.1 hypothetical protein X559_3061 [Listeria newyorkensis]PNP94283.1 hypothetical protein BMT55_01995 [Listeria newyorkensis]RQW67759.1 metal-sensitive transcriptional regulator [Listeria sp. SHR_NRA_18]